jgi:hypothetical protein
MHTPRWIFVSGRHRCQHCGQDCLGAWLWFEKPTTWTVAYCEPCAEDLTREEVNVR